MIAYWVKGISLSSLPCWLTHFFKKKNKRKQKNPTEMCLARCCSLFLPILKWQEKLSPPSLACPCELVYVKEVAYGELLLPAFCFGTEHHTAVLAIQMWALVFVFVESTNCGSILLYPDLSSMSAPTKTMICHWVPPTSPLLQPEFSWLWCPR